MKPIRLRPSLLRRLTATAGLTGLALAAVATAAPTEPCQYGDLIPTSERSRQACLRVRPGLIEKLAQKGLRFGAPIFIRIFKEPAELEVWLQGETGFVLFKTYTICDYSGELGPKLAEGDKQAPEGFYWVGAAQLNPRSKFHLAFDLGFPNPYDQSNEHTGSAIMVHGRCSSAGCFAMADFRMDEIYTLAEAALAGGQPAFAVHIFPFPMSEENLGKHQDSPWRSFWQNLREGYDLFESYHLPPAVSLAGRKYSFSPPPATAEIIHRPEASDGKI